MRNIENARRDYLDEYLGFDYILDEYHDSRMSEFVVSCGGDVNTYRVYGNTKEDFRITAR